MLHSFNLLSHPDRTLKEHLDSCYDIGRRVLQQKRIHPSFVDKDDLHQLFKQLVYFHDMGKATDFFQYRIIEATKANNSSYVTQRQDYFDYFDKNKSQFAQKSLEEDDRIGNHSLIGAYFQLAQQKRKDKIEELILFKIIKKHHGNLTNFIKDAEGRGEVLLYPKIIKRLDKQIQHLNFDLYRKILPVEFQLEQGDWENLKKCFSKALTADRVERLLLKKKDLRYFFFQHYLFFSFTICGQRRCQGSQ